MAATLEYNRPWLYSKQLEALFNEARYALVEATTKSGKTVGCMAWLFEEAAAGEDGQNFWWVAPTIPVAKIAFRRMKRGLPTGIYKANETELTLTFVNGAVIWFKGGDKPDTLYGEDVYAAVVDEATRCKEDAWIALRSTLTATRGPVRIIGNVKGRKNWAFKLARRAESGEPGMSYAKITAYDAVEAGILAAEEIEDARRTLPEDVFRELYLAEPSDDGGNPFGLRAIKARVAPLSEAPPVAFGIDLAKSVDWTVVVGLDVAGRVSVFERFQAPWPETIRRIRAIVGGVRALVDSTGVGDPVLEELQRGDARGGPAENFEGYLFTSGSKQRLMEGLAVAIQQAETAYPEGPVTSELEAFEYEYTRTGVRYSAPEGMHDDCVMGLGLAVEMFKRPAAGAGWDLW